MTKELVIDSGPSEISIALLEDKTLVELNKDKTNKNFSVGDIYLGKVKKIMPGLNAAFVDVGYEKDAFLHYLDLGPQVKSLMKYSRLAATGKLKTYNLKDFHFENDIEKTGKITQVLSAGQQVVVQIAKEPISTKGPRVTSELSFAGRYLVLVPFSTKVSVSQKISSAEERNRLKRLILSIKPANFGIIIRTVAENKLVADLDSDMQSLILKFENLGKKLISAIAPQKVISEIDRTSAILRDILSESFHGVMVNDPGLEEEIRAYITSIAPDKAGIVKLYKGKVPIFEFFGIDKQLKNSFGKIVTIKSGIYLIIEHTEALHVIDVNSGHRVKKEKGQEDNAIEVNCEAAIEIARQLRLRDMGGIIVIDFIDMLMASNKRKLYQTLKDEMDKDRAKHTILPPSKFGLVQITRQRVRPEMNIDILEKCPSCDGTGEIRSSLLIIDQIENNIKYLLQDQNEQWLGLAVHPYVFAFLTKGLYSQKVKWYFKYKKWIRLTANNSFHFLEYHFYNKNNDELKM